MSSASAAGANGTATSSGKDNSSKSSSAAAAAAAAPREPAPPLVNLTNDWLLSLSSRIRSRPIPWEGYQRADLVSSEELRMIRSIDATSSTSTIKEETMEKQGNAYAQLYLRLLAKLGRTDTIQQVLVLVTDMLKDHDERIELFKHVPAPQEAGGEAGEASPVWPWAPLIKLLDVTDDFVQLKAAHILTLLLLSPSKSSATKPPQQAIERLLDFLSLLINTGGASGAAALHPSRAGNGVLAAPSATTGYAEGNGADVAIQLLQALLRDGALRQQVWSRDLERLGEVPSASDHDHDGGGDGDGAPHQTPGIISGLTSILRATLVGSGEKSGSATPGSTSSSSISAQTTYQVIFSLWLLTFAKDIASSLNVKFTGTISLLVDVARGANKEKVVRITLATLRNLLSKAEGENAKAMLGAKGLDLIAALKARQWGDEEIKEDLDAIGEVLAEKQKGMSSLDEYAAEVASGKLTFETPMHSLDEFWKENAAKIVGDDDGQILKSLVGILKSEESDLASLAVAASDLGRIVSVVDSAKKKLDKLGAKARCLELIQHSDPDVRFRAISTVSKLVSASWK